MAAAAVRTPSATAIAAASRPACSGTGGPGNACRSRSSVYQAATPIANAARKGNDRSQKLWVQLMEGWSERIETKVDLPAISGITFKIKQADAKS